MIPTYSPLLYTDPTMRPYLEQYYQHQYEPFRERIAAMKDAEARGEGPITVALADGREAKELGPSFYEAAIPSFEKWLQIQQEILPRIESFTQTHLEQARRHVKYLEAQTPESSSQVRAVFADGDRILGYISQSGGVVSHSGGEALQTLARNAELLGLTGGAKIEYVVRGGTEALSVTHQGVHLMEYTQETMPSKRKFMTRWYPDHPIDTSYSRSLSEAYAMLDQAEAWFERSLSHRAEMMQFLLQAQEVSLLSA